MERVLSADEHLFAVARRGVRLSNVVVAPVVAWALLCLSRVPLLMVQWLAPDAFSRLAGCWPVTSSQAGDSGQVYGALLLDLRLWSTFIPLGGLALAWAVLAEGRPLASFVVSLRGAGRRALVGAMLGICAVLLICGIAAVCGEVRAVPGDRGSGQSVALAVGLAGLGWAIQGTGEELLSRGWLMTSLGARYGPWFGIAASSLLFASFHILNPDFGWLPGLNLALIGGLFGLVAVWQRCFWGVFALHAAWNWTLAHALGLTVSGIDVPGPSLVRLDLDGPSWLVGGAFGVEGGVATTIVAALGILGIVWMLRRRTEGRCEGSVADQVDGSGGRGSSPEGRQGSDA